MKKIKRWMVYRCIIVGLGVALLACQKANDTVSAGSNFEVVPQKLNALDQWIQDSLLIPYNIDVSYRWASSLHDLSKYAIPPAVDKVKPVLELLKRRWLDPYKAVGGKDFVKKMAPRQLVLVGGKLQPPQGGLTALGLAEAGKRVTLSEINSLNTWRSSSNRDLTKFMHVIHHEYAHILHQTQSFDEQVWNSISPEGYTSQWYEQTDDESRNVGFISAYARSNLGEDFAEMVGFLLSRHKAYWDNIIGGVSVLGKARIKKKEQMVVNYFKDLGIDIYVLRDAVNGDMSR